MPFAGSDTFTAFLITRACFNRHKASLPSFLLRRRHDGRPRRHVPTTPIRRSARGLGRVDMSLPILLKLNDSMAFMIDHCICSRHVRFPFFVCLAERWMGPRGPHGRGSMRGRGGDTMVMSDGSMSQVLLPRDSSHSTPASITLCIVLQRTSYFHCSFVTAQ